MDLLERIWEAIGLFFGSVTRSFERGLTSVFGSSNARYVKKLQNRVDAINELESTYEQMKDEELCQQSERFKQRLAAGETLEDIQIEAFAVCREAGRRYLSMRHYDVQLIGGMVLHSGAIAEMVTGEGKTLVATLPAYLNALAGKGVHVVTVNDYLARRDMEWMGPIYLGLGLTVGAIQSDMSVHDRQKAYDCDITYGTNNEFGFDYLRDNMRRAARGDHQFPKHMQQSQSRLTFAIVDEVDNILIDEARTPLIISGPAHDNIKKYADADRISRQLKRNDHYEVNEKDHNVNLTDAGVRAAEKLAGVESFYTAGNMEWPHLIDNSLKAHHLYQRDVNYVVKEGRVIIVDEFTGRLMDGRQWSDGLHQAVEAKEGVRIKEESQTLATITLQNFFKLYDKICGMTGTAMTEASEFLKIYELDVVAIPTNRELQRKEHPDVIYCTEEEKYAAIADEIEQLNKWDTVTLKVGDALMGTIVKDDEDSVLIQQHQSKQKETVPRSKIVNIQRKGRPVLVGTTSIEKSERVSKLLDRRGVDHQVLNAKHHKREAEIVAQAGRLGAVTIATNMAGRGTDIVLGGNPETMVWAKLQETYETRLDVPRNEWDALVAEIDEREQMSVQGESVKEIGGLHVIGTERHEARRIDLQLRGRCGRQGDPGSSRFYLSLTDDLMRIFAGPWVEKILKSLGMPEGDAIESKMVTRRIEAAQKKVEERNFEIRKNLLEYDEVMDEQRKRVYSFRQNVLDGANCKQLILDMVDEQVSHYVKTLLARDYGVESFVSWAGTRLSCNFEPRDFRDMDFDAAQQLAKDEADRMAETQLFEAIEENLPEDEESSSWNWQALAKFANTRWGLSFRDRELKKVGRDGVVELLYDKAREGIQASDLSDGRPLLSPDFGLNSVCGWVQNKFDIELDINELKRLEETSAVVKLVGDKARAAYDEKECEYPVMAGLYRFSSRTSSGLRVDRQQLVDWARGRFDIELDLEDFKNKQRDEIRSLLVEHSKLFQEKGKKAAASVRLQLDRLFATADTDTTAGAASGNGALDSLSNWAQQDFNFRMSAQQMATMERGQLENKLLEVVDGRYRPEMRRMEREVVLQIVDTAWKDHLLAMDHLRSAVGLVGYAQVDPKVEYKREGMRIFEQMWSSIHQRTTDLIYRMEQLDEGFVDSTWVETEAVHEQAQSTGEMAQQQDRAIQDSQGGDGKIDPIRNRGNRVGRNDPCTCGSGKKYKNCCLRNRVA